MKKIKLSALILIFILAFGQVSVFAADSEALTELTVRQALTMAINNSDEIKSTLESEVTLKASVRTAKDTMLESTSSSTYVSAYKSMTEAQLSLSLLEDDTAVMKEKLEYNLQSYFAQIIKDENALALTDKELDITKRNLDISALKLSLGLISQSTYDSEAYAYEAALIARDTTAASIDGSYRTLNKLMGQSLDKKYNLVLDLAYEPISDSFNLTTTIARDLENSSDIKTLEKKVYLAQYNSDTITAQIYDTTGYYGGSDADAQREDAKNAVSQASRELDNKKTELEASVRSNYDSVKTLERTYESALKDLEQLKSELTILETKLELGQATQLEVDSKLLSIEQKEESIRSTIYEHQIKMLTLTNPNLASQ